MRYIILAMLVMVTAVPVTRTVPATASIAYTVIPVRSPTSVTLADTGRRVVQLADDGRRLLVLPDDGRRRVEVV